MSPQQTRLKIFNLYASNWTIVHSKYPWSDRIPVEYRTAVLCPMCLSLFNISSLDQSLPNPLSLEHVPSARLGGKAKILTCKKCNNESGRLLDHSIFRFIDAEPFMRLEHGSEIQGTTTVNRSDGQKINSRTIIRVQKDNTFVFKAQIKKGEWRAEQLKNMSTNPPVSINFNFSVPSVRRTHVALLRFAYLTAFEKFGHAFILDTTYNALRAQILEPEKGILEPKGSMLLSSSNAVSDGIYVVTTPFNSKSFCVILSLSVKGAIKKACVFLPAPFTKSVEFYEKFNALPSQNFQIDLSEKFLNLDFLTDIHCAFSFKNAFR
jgi:hypothetical protein